MYYPVCGMVYIKDPLLLIRKSRERNVLFNDALNTFYLRLYGVRHIVKDHSDGEKGNPLPPHRLLLLITIFFYKIKLLFQNKKFCHLKL